MRTIKFRGKRIDTGKWIYGDLLTSNGTECEISDWDDVVYSRYDVEPDTVGQFTGLLDKNGKEIYEGDVIGFIKGEKTGQLTYTVKWMNGGFWLSDRGYGGKLEPQLRDLENFARSGGYQTMIVGNIHDNPELLKGGNNGNSTY